MLGGGASIGLGDRDNSPQRSLYEGWPCSASIGPTPTPTGRSWSAPSLGRLIRTFVDLLRFDVRVVNAQNVRLREIMGADISSLEHNRSSVALAFDTHGVARIGGKLDLRLTVPGFTLRQKKTATEWGLQRGERITSFGEASKSDNSGLSLFDRLRRAAPSSFGDTTIGATLDVGVDHPLTIPFSVPVDPVRVEVHPNQAVAARGTTLILDRVIATRSRMRIYLRRAVPGHILENAQLELSVDGQHFSSNDALFGDWWTRSASASSRYDFAIPGEPYRSGTTYTLTVRPRVGVTSPGTPWRTLQGGHWAFQFSLP